MIDSFEPAEQALPHLRRVLAEVDQESRRRLGGNAPRFGEETLAQEHERNPSKVVAFLQALATTTSPHMLLMVWRILQGMKIASVEASYQEQSAFRLVVRLRSPYDEADRMEEYVSDNILDAGLLRHFGIMLVDNLPLFDGFYPLRLTD